MARISSGLSARAKKIALKKIEQISTSRLADIWKINRDKKLDADEMDQFELVRKEYKSRTGKELPKHTQKGD